MVEPRIRGVRDAMRIEIGPCKIHGLFAGTSLVPDAISPILRYSPLLAAILGP